MSLIGDLVQIEMRGARGKRISEKAAQFNLVILFFCVFLGIFFSFLYEFLTKYIADPSKVVFNSSIFIAQLLLSLIVVPIIFLSIYKLLDVNTSETWMIYFVAFQNGYFWKDLLGKGVGAAAGSI